MKIAILSDLFYPYLLGGAEKQVYEIARRLAKKHDVHVYTMNLEGSPSYEVREGIKIHRLGITHGLRKRSMLPLLAYFLSFPKIRKELESFDVINASQAAGIFSFIHNGNAPIVLTIYDLYLSDWKKYYPFPLYLAGQVLEKKMMMGRYDRVVTISEMSREKVVKQDMKAPVSVVNMGIDFDRIRKVKVGKRSGVVFVGRLVAYKNIDVLIKAMKKVQERSPKEKLAIIGSGDEELRLKALAKELGVSVRFLGFAPENEKIRLIKSSVAFVSMSSVEGFGIALLEAMAAGTPVIAKRLGCYREFCTKDNSMLIPESRLSKSIMLLLKNKRLWKKISANGIRTAKNFSWNKVAERMEKEYESAIRQKVLAG